MDLGCILINTASHEAVSFDDADKFCKKLDQTAQLLEIHAKDQLDFINVLLNHEGTSSYWLGASDEDEEGEWFWLNSREPVGDFVWFQGEPDSGTIANCMQYTASYDSASDQFCLNHNFPLCQLVRNETKIH